MDKVEYIVYLKEEYGHRRTFECSTVNITNMGAVTCQLARDNKRFMMPLSSIYYIRILDDDETSSGFDDDGGYGMPNPIEPLFDTDQLTNGNLDLDIGRGRKPFTNIQLRNG